MVHLDAYAAQANFRHIVWVRRILTADFSVSVLRKIDEYLAVKHRVLMQVEQLGPSRVASLFFLLLLLPLSLIFFLLCL